VLRLPCRDARRAPGCAPAEVSLWNGGHVDPAEIFARGCLLNDGESTYDPEDVLPWVAKLRAAFPDIRFEIAGWFAADTRYVLRFRASGTHTGPFETEIGKAQPSGNRFTAHGIESLRSATNAASRMGSMGLAQDPCGPRRALPAPATGRSVLTNALAQATGLSPAERHETSQLASPQVVSWARLERRTSSCPGES
jgi:hypothetical protein